MRVRIAVPLCLFAVLFYSGCGSPSKSESTVDTRFIPADATAVIVVYPARVLANPAIAKLDLSNLTKDLEMTFGVAPREIEQIEMIFARSQPEPLGAAEIRLTKPHGGEVFVNRFLSRKEPPMTAIRKDGAAPPVGKQADLEIAPEKVEYAGKVYYKPGKSKSGFQRNAPIVSIIDERTVLIGNEAGVKTSLDAKDVKSPLITLLGKVDPAADFSVVAYPTDEFKKMMSDAKTNGELPLPLQPTFDLVDSSNGSIFSLKTTPEISLTLTMEAKDDAAAEKLAAMFPEVKQMAEKNAAEVHRMARSVPPDAKPMLDYGVGMLDKLVAGLVAKRDGNQVVIQIDGLGTLDELATTVLTPAIAKARVAAKLAQGMNNIQQLGIAMLSYDSQFGRLPTQAIYSKDGKPLLSWRVNILPFVDENELYMQFHLDEPWDSPNNKPLIAKMPKVFLSADDKGAAGKTRYVVPVGKGTLFDGDKGIPTSEVTHGTAFTIMILEVGDDKAVTWTKPDDLPFDPGNPLAGLGAVGDAGLLAAFADAHSVYIRKTVDADTFRKLILLAEGEAIDESKYLAQ